MTPGLRKFALTIHLTCSVGWIGAALAYVALGTLASTSSEPQDIRAAWIAMELMGWYVIVPLAASALLTGLVISLGTPWGLFRHYWVMISFGLTVFATAVLVLHMPTVTHGANLARASDVNLEALGGDLFHSGLGLAVLIVVTVLNVYKPRGVTPYGWRKQQEERARSPRID